MSLAKSDAETSIDIHAYKPFIDGLRAVAILAVVAGHLELPGASGGFIGVDVFFVISGYLIINQIIADIRYRRFNLMDFWARRVLRILPPFLLVTIACLTISGIVLVQPEFREFTGSFFFSTIMQANHYFLSKQDYFETVAYVKPLLHTWSLSVEEQFYFVAPLALVGTAAWTNKLSAPAAARLWSVVTVGLLAVSFALCVVLTRDRHNFAFYLMIPRGWEFLLGGIVPLCVGKVRGWPGAAITSLALAGTAAIAFALGTFGAETAYPSYLAALPALGTMLIIVGGLAGPSNIVARILASRPFVAIGLVSYAWYLWHWPLLSFIRLANSGTRDLAIELGAMGLALVMAILTWRFVERPIREWRRSARRQSSTVVLAGIAGCIIIGGAGGLWSKFAMPHLTPSLAGLEPLAIADNAYPPAIRRGALIGDSQADELAPMLTDRARRSGSALSVTKYGGCPPVLEVTIFYNHKPSPICGEVYKNIFQEKSEFLILAAVWDLYLTPPPSDRDFIPFGVADPQTGSQATDPYALFARGLTAMIVAAKQAGVKRILVIGPSPRFPARPPNCVLRIIRLGLDHCSADRASIDARLTRTMDILRKVTAGFEDVRLIDPISAFCTPSVCPPYAGHTIYFKDTIHLSPAGTERLYESFHDDFRWVFIGD